MHLRHSRSVLVALVGLASFGSLGADVRAQGVTTATIQGTVRAADGSDVDGARVEVVNGATGFAVDVEVRSGRFLVQGLEIGGPYTIQVERLGLLPQRIEDVFLRTRRATALGVRPGYRPHRRRHPAGPGVRRVPNVNTHGGTATTLADSLLHRLPTLNRNLYDFLRLVPQISTKTGLAASMSGGGAGLRFNDFLINGASERTLSGGLTSNQNGGKSVPLEAVREYQVLLAPYDVRYGDFAGALVNTVTRSGTNQFQGSAFAYWRNDRLARGGELAPADPYDQVQYGFSLGGPILTDRLHFFVAPELQHLESPAPGPWVGQPSTATPPVPVDVADIERLDDILRGFGLEAGSGGPVENGTPLRNVFGRLGSRAPGMGQPLGSLGQLRSNPEFRVLARRADLSVDELRFDHVHDLVDHLASAQHHPAPRRRRKQRAARIASLGFVSRACPRSSSRSSGSWSRARPATRSRSSRELPTSPRAAPSGTGRSTSKTRSLCRSAPPTS